MVDPLDAVPLLETPLRRVLAERALLKEQAAGWSRVPIADMGTIDLSKGYWSMGQEKTTNQRTKTKYVDEQAWPVASGELGRWYLEFCADQSDASPNWLRARSNRSRPPIPPPALYFRPNRDGMGPRGPWCYIDLRAAYFQLYEHCTYDLFWHRSKGLSLGGWDLVATEDWGAHKRSRNAVMGMAQARSMLICDNGVWRDLAYCGPFYAPCFATYVLDTMHAIASDIVRRFKAPLWLVDACAVRPEAAQAVLDHLRDRWAVEARVVAQGDGYLWSVNDYQIGHRLTERVKRLEFREGAPVDNLTRFTAEERKRIQRTRQWLVTR